jgi:hypothetical protein
VDSRDFTKILRKSEELHVKLYDSVTKEILLHNFQVTADFQVHCEVPDHSDFVKTVCIVGDGVSFANGKERTIYTVNNILGRYEPGRLMSGHVDVKCIPAKPKGAVPTLAGIVSDKNNGRAFIKYLINKIPETRLTGMVCSVCDDCADEFDCSVSCFVDEYYVEAIEKEAAKLHTEDVAFYKVY